MRCRRPSACGPPSPQARGDVTRGRPARHGRERTRRAMSDSSPKSLRFEVSAETSASPEQVIEIAGKDFSARRAEIWPNVRTTHFVVHDQGTDHAEVTEGGTGPARFIWERCRYEWSRPDAVTSTVIDSNAVLPGTTFELRAVPREGGGSTVEM